jgi:hypothetical protein
LDKKDVYLWGTLLALVREQLAAIDKHVQGTLGMWGRARLQSRTKEIQKFIFKLMERKMRFCSDEALEALHADLAEIRADNGMWHDVTPSELEYVRTILAGLE